MILLIRETSLIKASLTVRVYSFRFKELINSEIKENNNIENQRKEREKREKSADSSDQRNLIKKSAMSSNVSTD